MRVSFRWMQTGRRGRRVSKTVPLVRAFVTGLALTALAPALLPVHQRFLHAASFDEPGDPAAVTAVLLHDAPSAPPAEDEDAEDESSLFPTEAARFLDEAGQPTMAADTILPPPPAGSCTAEEGEPCDCPACRGETLFSEGPSAGLVGTVGAACLEGLCRRGPLADCDPDGLIQRLAHRHKTSGACWSGRADLLLMWRNAPPAQALLTTAAGATALDANNVDSALAAGPRFSLFRTDTCGHAWEATYLRGFNFRGRQTTPTTAGGYAIAAPGIFGDQEIDLNGAGINLGSGIQSFEFNRYHKVSTNIRLLAGFRWVEWRESATLETAVPTGDVDLYQSNCMNSLYGGQLGFEANVLSTQWLRVESLLKGGAYGNNVAANSLLVKPAAGVNESLAFNQSPASCGFVGELGFTGVVPITSCLDFRFGYFGLWLQGLAQPTRQFLTQDLLNAPPSGTLDTRGGTVVQGVSLGLEGRW